VSVYQFITAARFDVGFTLQGTHKPLGQCKACGKEFSQNTGTGRKRIFCGPQCRPKRVLQPEELICGTCNKAFVGLRGKKYCSAACRPRVTVSRPQFNCIVCGKLFVKRTATRTGRYCSRACVGTYAARCKHEAGLLVLTQCSACNEWFARGEMTYPKKGWCSEACKRVSLISVCEYCGVDFVAETKGKRFCSRPCYLGSQNARQKELRGCVPIAVACVECNKSFFTKKRTGQPKYCSIRCMKKVDKRKRRALKKNAYIEAVHISTLIRRDVGVCQICNKSVDLTATVPDDLAPTVDHVIPLSKGGEHSYANCQLAHFLCNSYKNDNIDTLF
jgi:hypothetical protein